MKRIKLFCLPYAGGSSAVFNNWKQHISEYISICPLEYAGRGVRYSTPFYSNVSEAVEDLYCQIEQQLDESTDYAILGYSLGAVLAYELYYKIARSEKKLPINIFFSASKAPNMRNIVEKIHELDEHEFKCRIENLGGTPKEVLEDKELMDIFIPILRADFKLYETYEYINRPNKIECDITIIFGDKDEITLEEITEWRKHAAKECNIYSIEGNHFFINDNAGKVIKIINSSLSFSNNALNNY